MNVEQVARDFIATMADPAKTKARLTPDATISGGILPKPVRGTEAVDLMGALKTAFPDLKFDVRQVTVSGNQATVRADWSGTNTGALHLPLAGAPNIPPTGKSVKVPDEYRVTVQGDKVSHLEIASPSDGGIPGALAQIGVKFPGM
jgi:SnoaL-like protein